MKPKGLGAPGGPGGVRGTWIFCGCEALFFSSELMEIERSPKNQVVFFGVVFKQGSFNLPILFLGVVDQRIQMYGVMLSHLTEVVHCVAWCLIFIDHLFEFHAWCLVMSK